MGDSGNRVVVQEGYLLPFQAYRARRGPVQAIGANKRTRQLVNVRSRRGHGPKSAAYKAQQGKMKNCAKKWRAYDGGASYRSFMSGCLKSRR